MQPIRRVQGATHFKQVPAPPMDEDEEKDEESSAPSLRWMPCSPGAEGAVEKSWMEVEPDELLEEPVSMRDMLQSLECSKPAANEEDLERLKEFTGKYGQDGS